MIAKYKDLYLSLKYVYFFKNKDILFVEFPFHFLFLLIAITIKNVFPPSRWW